MKTELENRTLWFDGTNEVAAELIPELIFQGVPISKIISPEESEDIELYNNLADVSIAKNKSENDLLDFSWQIPKSYVDINLDRYILQELSNKIPDENKREQYLKRANDELHEIRFRGIEMLFKTLIYIIDRFKKSNTVWGVGRGSSCASLVLFIIGLHRVDPVKYGIPLTEFFHD